MTDGPIDRPEPVTEPYELAAADVDLIVEALRYLESTLGREEAEQIERIQAILARLGRAPGVGPAGPTF